MFVEGLSFLDRILPMLWSSAWEGLFVAVVVALFGAFGVWLWKRLRPWLRRLFGSKYRLDRALAADAADGKGLWLHEPIRPQAGYRDRFRTCRPIIVIANLKGGVGKTTLAANLLAHYAIRKNERVLGIDLDFQGSLTANALSKANRDSLLVLESDHGLSKAARLIDDRDASWLLYAPDEVDQVSKGKLISTYYSLAAVENRIMIEWLLGQRPDDVRYHLANVLHDPIIQRSFDRIIIDAPPRLTTAAVQALCAATHVLIPTILDELSSEAVGAFADQLRINQSLWPRLKILGVVGTMTNNLTVGTARPLADVEVDALAAGRRQLAQGLGSAADPLRDASFLPVDCFIPDRMELSRAAGHRIAYASQSNAAPIQAIREAFDRLGDEIDRRIAERS
jgi:cellulose biosynthesis protein BcsQ